MQMSNENLMSSVKTVQTNSFLHLSKTTKEEWKTEGKMKLIALFIWNVDLGMGLSVMNVRLTDYHFDG